MREGKKKRERKTRLYCTVRERAQAQPWPHAPLAAVDVVNTAIARADSGLARQVTSSPQKSLAQEMRDVETDEVSTEMASSHLENLCDEKS